jgi:hypothetical protein
MNDKARNTLHAIDGNIGGVTRRIAEVAAICTNFPGYPANPAPFFQPQPPPLPVLNQNATAAEVAVHETIVQTYENSVAAYIERIQIILETARTQSDALSEHSSHLQEFSLTCDDLANRFSIFTRKPDCELVRKIRELIAEAQRPIDDFSKKLSEYLSRLYALIEESAANLDATRAALEHANQIMNAADSAAAAAAAAAASAAAAVLKPAAPVRNPWKRAVLISVFVVLLQIAVTNSGTSASPKNPASPSTLLALLENYFDSGFSSYFQTLVLEIVGVFPLHLVIRSRTLCLRRLIHLQESSLLFHSSSVFRLDAKTGKSLLASLPCDTAIYQSKTAC